VIPTSQTSAIATPRTSFETSSTRRPAAITIAAAPNCATSFAIGLRCHVVEETGEEDEPAAGEDPGEQPGRVDDARRDGEPDAREQPDWDPDPTEERRRAVVPASAARHRDEPPAERRGAQQRREHDRSDRERDERDGRFHGRSL